MDVDADEDVKITVSQQPRPRQLWHARSASTSSETSTESEWMEVDDLLGGPGTSTTSADPVDRSPDGSHTILRVMTDKLLGLKRIVRKVEEGEATEAAHGVPSVPDLDTLAQDDLQGPTDAHEQSTYIPDHPTSQNNIDRTADSGNGCEARFPDDSIARNIHRFMRYSSAAYGVSGTDM